MKSFKDMTYEELIVTLKQMCDKKAELEYNVVRIKEVYAQLMEDIELLEMMIMYKENKEERKNVLGL